VHCWQPYHSIICCHQYLKDWHCTVIVITVVNSCAFYSSLTMVLLYLVIKSVNVYWSTLDLPLQYSPHQQVLLANLLVAVMSSSSCTVVWTRLIDELTPTIVALQHWCLSILCYYLAPIRTSLSRVHFFICICNSFSLSLLCIVHGSDSFRVIMCESLDHIVYRVCTSSCSVELQLPDCAIFRQYYVVLLRNLIGS